MSKSALCFGLGPYPPPDDAGLKPLTAQIIFSSLQAQNEAVKQETEVIPITSTNSFSLCFYFTFFQMRSIEDINSLSLSPHEAANLHSWRLPLGCMHSDSRCGKERGREGNEDVRKGSEDFDAEVSCRSRHVQCLCLMAGQNVTSYEA